MVKEKAYLDGFDAKRNVLGSSKRTKDTTQCIDNRKREQGQERNNYCPRFEALCRITAQYEDDLTTRDGSKGGQYVL